MRKQTAPMVSPSDALEIHASRAASRRDNEETVRRQEAARGRSPNTLSEYTFRMGELVNTYADDQWSPADLARHLSENTVTLASDDGAECIEIVYMPGVQLVVHKPLSVEARRASAGAYFFDIHVRRLPPFSAKSELEPMYTRNLLTRQRFREAQLSMPFTISGE